MVSIVSFISHVSFSFFKLQPTDHITLLNDGNSVNGKSVDICGCRRAYPLLSSITQRPYIASIGNSMVSCKKQRIQKGLLQKEYCSTDTWNLNDTFQKHVVFPFALLFDTTLVCMSSISNCLVFLTGRRCFLEKIQCSAVRVQIKKAKTKTLCKFLLFYLHIVFAMCVLASRFFLKKKLVSRDCF